MFVLALAAHAAPLLTDSYARTHSDQLWASFVDTYKPAYSSAAEEHHRRRVFNQSMAAAAAQQALNPLAVFGVTQFSDLTDEEFAQRKLGLKPTAIAEADAVPDLYSESEVAGAAASIDWRDYGVVTPVKDQGDCGGCWSFATTGNIESVSALKHGNATLTSLSEQELLDCDDYFPCMGCNGGEMSCAYLFLTSEARGNVATEQSYPYTAGASSKTGACKRAQSTVGATIRGSRNLPSDEAQMATWLASNGPIAIGAYAIPWKQYKSGILTSCGSGPVDHAILVVGYGAELGTPYWTIKNSWGEAYGEAGYIRVQRGVNLCKLASQPITATV